MFNFYVRNFTYKNFEEIASILNLIVHKLMCQINYFEFWVILFKIVPVFVPSFKILCEVIMEVEENVIFNNFHPFTSSVCDFTALISLSLSYNLTFFAFTLFLDN